jgi:hypothetical protein
VHIPDKEEVVMAPKITIKNVLKPTIKLDTATENRILLYNNYCKAVKIILIND